MKHNLVLLSEFRLKSGLSDTALMELLSRATLPLAINDGALYIDCAELPFDEILRVVSELNTQIDFSSREVLITEIGQIIEEELEQIIEQISKELRDGEDK